MGSNFKLLHSVMEERAMRTIGGTVRASQIAARRYVSRERRVEARRLDSGHAGRRARPVRRAVAGRGRAAGRRLLRHLPAPHRRRPGLGRRTLGLPHCFFCEVPRYIFLVVVFVSSEEVKFSMMLHALFFWSFRRCYSLWCSFLEFICVRRISRYVAIFSRS